MVVVRQTNEPHGATPILRATPSPTDDTPACTINIVIVIVTIMHVERHGGDN